MGGACVDSDSPPVYWDRSCVTYEFHERAFERIPSLTEDEIRAITSDSFAAWREVECGSGGFWVGEASGTTDAEPVGFLYDEPNHSVISVLSAEEWLDELGPIYIDAIAVTNVWRESETGRVIDVDLSLNRGTGEFGRCDDPCTDGTIDLQNTLTHEAGHFLGLSHSESRGATMYTYADIGQNFMRSLESDDRAGLCSLDLPAHNCASPEQCSCPTPPIFRPGAGSGGCSVVRLSGRTPFSGSSWPVFATIVAAIGVALRRRGARGAPV